jgi:hypothetical protein
MADPNQPNRASEEARDSWNESQHYAGGDSLLSGEIDASEQETDAPGENPAATNISSDRETQA